MLAERVVLRSWRWALGASILAACGSSGSARLQVELATAPPAGGGDGACDAREEPLPEGVDCLQVTACQRTASGCVPLQVARPGTDHSMAETSLRFDVDASGRFGLDIEAGDGRARQIEIRVFRRGAPFARGVLSDIGGAGGGDLRVRLERYEAWSCAGGRDDGGAAAPRALHQAVSLPDGDVLILGGVTGQRVSPTFGAGLAVGMAGAALERSVEVYDADDGRFHAVTMTDVDGGTGFGAVFHRAEYVETTSSGAYRIRSVGGFTATGGDPAARFDSYQSFSRFGSPVLPGPGAVARESVDILYDPSTRTATVETLSRPAPDGRGTWDRAGFDAVAAPHPTTGSMAAALGVLDAPDSGGAPAPRLSTQWFTLPTDPAALATGNAGEVMAARLGATLSWLDADTALLWGGNVQASSTLDVVGSAGEILGASTSSVASGVGGLPPATAFHTATPIDGGVLIAGGLEIVPLSSRTGGIGTVASGEPLTVVTRPAGGSIMGVAVEGAAWSATILHGATTVPGGGVVVAGGARRLADAMESANQLFGVNDAISVETTGTGAFVATALPGLITARWGHQVTRLGDDRVLVTGGFARRRESETASSLAALSAAEVLVLADPPAPIVACTASSAP